MTEAHTHLPSETDHGIPERSLRHLEWFALERAWQARCHGQGPRRLGVLFAPTAEATRAALAQTAEALQLLAAVGATGHVTAVDIHARKLAQLREEAQRCAIEPARVSTETIDLSLGDGGLAGGFDRVLVDAPCTGLGTILRRPEIAWRLAPEDPVRMAELQLRILERALGLLRHGGILVFAVCSGSAEEARGQHAGEQHGDHREHCHQQKAETRLRKVLRDVLAHRTHRHRK